MADPLSSIIDCLEIDISKKDIEIAFKGFKVIIDGFFAVLPNLFDPTELPKFAANIQFDVGKIPSAFLELLFESFGPNLPSFDLKIPELKIDVSYKGLDIDGFDPSGLIELLLGIVNLATSIPELFFDFDTKTPKVPSIDDINFGIKMPDFSEVKGFEDFAIKFPTCVLKAVTSVILP